ncbi:hypothetical protein ACHAWF_010332 [Thalassiosira exigua]
MANGQWCWAFGSTQYVQDAVNKVKKHLATKGQKLQVRASAPLASGYRPEVDASDKLGEDNASYYHSPIDVL